MCAWQAREALIQCQRKAVDITPERACAMCHKRISNSVFAVYPEGMIVSTRSKIFIYEWPMFYQLCHSD